MKKEAEIKRLKDGQLENEIAFSDNRLKLGMRPNQIVNFEKL